MSDEKQESQTRIVRKELNLDLGQFFYPQEKKKIFDIRYFYSKRVNEDNKTEIIRAVLHPNYQYGTLNTFDERVFYVLIELWIEQSKQKITYFSLRNLAKKINTTWGKGSADALFHSLTRLRTAYITWEGSFYKKDTNEYITIQSPFTILSYLHLTSSKDKGIGSEVGQFYFDENIITNLNNNHSRPIKFDVLLSFQSPLSQALYTHLDRKLYGTREYSRTTEGLLVNDLGLIGDSYKLKKIRLQKLKKAGNELVGKELAYGEIIENFEIENKKRGDAVFKVTRSNAKNSKVLLPTPKTKKTSSKNQSKSKDLFSPTIKEILDYFDNEFSLTSIKSSKVISKIEELLGLYGIDKIKFLISYSKQQATKTNYQPNSFNGIVKYFKNAIEQFEENQKLLNFKQKAKEEQKAKLLDSKNDDYKIENQKHYYQYVLKKLEMLSLEDLPEYKRFLEFEEQEKLKIEDKYKNRKIETKLKFLEVEIKHFNKRSVRANRAIKYFQNHSDIKIKDFWEWDKARTSKLAAC